MYWKLTCDPSTILNDHRPDGRFVLHRHRDASGIHLDLRLEHGDALMGWRIDGTSLETGAWATFKAPHPTAWLAQDGDAVRDDEGVYQWLERSSERRVLVLRGRHGDRLLRLDHVVGLPPACVRDVSEVLERHGLEPRDAGRIVADGLTARQRAIARLCGLGRDLDGDAFDEVLWRRTLENLALDEIHAQLRTFELRFDAKYPPEPVSQPDPLPEDTHPERTESVLSILRSI